MSLAQQDLFLANHSWPPLIISWFPMHKRKLCFIICFQKFPGIQVGQFSPLPFPKLLCFSGDWQHLSLLFPSPGVGEDSSWIPLGFSQSSTSSQLVSARSGWLEKPQLTEMLCSALSVLRGYSMDHCSFSLLRSEGKSHQSFWHSLCHLFPSCHPCGRADPFSTTVLLQLLKDSPTFLELSLANYIDFIRFHSYRLLLLFLSPVYSPWGVNEPLVGT